VLFCSGVSCGLGRIPRNAVYYSDAKNRNNWCDGCYTKLSPTELIVLDDSSEIKKSKLKFAKNDSVPEEVFLQCHDCKARVHQICALYNCRSAKPDEIFRCPKCINVYKEIHEIPSEDSKSGAKDLPKCSMSDFIEDGLLKSLDKAYATTASETGICIDQVEKPNGISVRVMSHVYMKHTVRDEMHRRYTKQGFPTDFPVHTKCIGLFQSIDGVDILVFAMYVYEYGQECPAPNRRRVYISYLDSVKYFEPERYRSIAYQSIIVEYLRFVKKRGFHTAHIWSCPPALGDEYVFHCHPPNQKVPKELMLRKWYYGVINQAKEQGIVIESTNFYDEYFNYRKWGSCGEDIPNAMSLPYFEGDYIPGEIETILSKIREDEIDNPGQQVRRSSGTVSCNGVGSGAIVTRSTRSTAESPKPRRRHSSGLRSGTRSNPGQLVNQNQDKVMNRLGMAISNMKENLIIVRLRNKHFAVAVDRGDDVSEWPDDDEYSPEILSNDYSKELHRINKSLSIPTKIGSTFDEDEQFESEMFENRQLFLNYCRGNRCQFDEIRRAKFSTIMLLYQLHNPSAPKFVRQCCECQRDIGNVRTRYRCNVCTDFDLCSDCFPLIKNKSRSHKGSGSVHPKSHTFSLITCSPVNDGAIELSSSKTTANTAVISKSDRAKRVKMFLQVLDHAAYCGGISTDCKLKNCAKMKQAFIHVKTCGGNMQQCKICSRLLSLIIVHARSCTVRDDSCPLPYCNKIRERNDRLRRQQRFMDDRRRQAQNAVYQQNH